MNLFSRWFGRSSRTKGKSNQPPTEEVVSLPFVADMHSHLLPGLDDGVGTMEEAYRLIRGMKTAGYRRAITTPHIMGDYYRNTREGILSQRDVLLDYLHKQDFAFELEAAAEYYLDEWFLDKLRREPLLSFGPDMVLVETSYINRPPNMKEVFFEMKMKGYQPVLAHPERYIYLHGQMEEVAEWRDAGVLMQMNLPSISGYYGPQVKRAADILVQNGWVDLVGTDLHGQRHWNACLKATRSRHFRLLIDNPLQNGMLSGSGNQHDPQTARPAVS